MVLKWEESGVGTPIVLLHGFGGSSRDYLDLTEYLRAHGRVYTLHLSPLYSSRTPMTFSDMVNSVEKTLRSFLKPNECFHLFGTSFGGTLSWAVRLRFSDQVLSHTLINPMPLNPMPKLKHPFLRWMIKYGRAPRLMKWIGRTDWGQNSLIELGMNFRITFFKHHEERRFHKRKLDLIAYALNRFFWISSNEKWRLWEIKSDSAIKTQGLLITGHKDPLYSIESFSDYKKYADFYHHILPSGEHLATKTHAEEIAYLFVKHILTPSQPDFKKVSNL